MKVIISVLFGVVFSVRFEFKGVSPYSSLRFTPCNVAGFYSLALVRVGTNKLLRNRRLSTKARKPLKKGIKKSFPLIQIWQWRLTCVVRRIICFQGSFSSLHFLQKFEFLEFLYHPHISSFLVSHRVPLKINLNCYLSFFQ